MAVPTLTVDLAFGSSPGASSFSWTNVHTDGGVMRGRDLSYQRGRQNELNQIATGTSSLVLGDAASDFDPDNPSGLYSANVRPYVPVRAQATIGGVTYPLFQHFVARWPRTLRVVNVWTERSVDGVDGFEWLGNAGLNSASYSTEASGTRVANVLNTVGWSSALRTIGAGNATLDPSTFTATDGTKALQHLQDVASSENGLFFVDAGGKMRFVQRHDLIVSPYTVSQATFHDAKAGGAGYAFKDVQPAFDLDTTFNQWVGMRMGGTAQTATDTVSQGLYGVRTQQFSSLVTTDADVLSQAQWKLGVFAAPLNRIASVTVMPGIDTGFWQTVLALEIGQRITLREQAPGFAAVKQSDYTIQSLSAHFPAGTPAAATFQFGLWPASTNTFWQAGLTGFSEAGATTRAAY